MEPTTAMAPTHTTSEAVTKASVKWGSPVERALTFSQSPKRSSQRAMLIHSPSRPPSTMEPMSSMELRVVSSPSAPACIRPVRAPAMPINITHRPMICINIS